MALRRSASISGNAPVASPAPPSPPQERRTTYSLFPPSRHASAGGAPTGVATAATAATTATAAAAAVSYRAKTTDAPIVSSSLSSGSPSSDHSHSHSHAHSHSLPAMQTAVTTTTTTTSTAPHRPRFDSLPPSFSPPQAKPIAIPARTSSNNALTSGEQRQRTSSLQSTNTASPNSKKSADSKKRRSLGAVPEERRRLLPQVDEQSWMGQSKNQRLASSSTTSSLSVPTAGRPSLFAMATSADLINDPRSSWTAEKENILRGPFDYLELHPGKDIRAQLISAFNEWLQVPTASLQVIIKVVSMLHTASLLIDDVEDNSQLRRGIPVAHSIFGTPQTINCANYVYFCALQELFPLNNPELIRIYTDELLNLHRGQGMDLFWRDTLTCPTEDDYLEMVANKTGGLFRLAIKLMCAESPSYNSPDRSAEYVPLVDTVGLLFQILDDYRNLSDTTYTANKGLCEDLTEGKFSFPIIHAIRSDPSNLVLINILKQKTTDDDVKRYAVAYMDRCGSFSYTRRVLRGLTKKALSLVDDVDQGRGKGGSVRSFLEKLRVDKSERTSASPGTGASVSASTSASASAGAGAGA